MKASSLDVENLLSQACAIAREAGAAILEVYGTRFSTSEKADLSPLTEADLASHRIIQRRLRELTPEIPLLSEEGRDVPFEERRNWSTFWLIDPLDGTKEFVKRNGEFTVNIALIQDHAPVLGVVFSPVLDTLYAGAPGIGAFVESADGGRRDIGVRWPAPEQPSVVSSRSHRDARLGRALERLGPHEAVAMGSSLKLCLVADGSADLYPRLGPTSEWDTAAAHAVVCAAGGRVCDLQGQDLRYNTRESVLNPEFLVCAREPEVWLRRLSLWESAANPA
ncbi:MAG TPA: 3'(2'),5'-bisphosphate nucleotidase CysQ [Thioalkalivibrio sp.]|nr:3'(2'),5'-bisphosphate nucleotidase CysQ [Thioalkalivibrio sp.]